RMGTIVKHNPVLATANHLIAVPFAITGILTPSMAVLALFARSFSVALNSLRLKILPQPRR
ncbi:hypothetical protein, partial [Agrobacterium rubi]|uniref:hypothetical protein n=1 Tax=Agrobacterium rubi TaxID=28099 RepID=UPI00201B7528